MWTSLDDLKLGQNRSVRSGGVVSVQGQSDFACPNKKSACPGSRKSFNGVDVQKIFMSNNEQKMIVSKNDRAEK